MGPGPRRRASGPRTPRGRTPRIRLDRQVPRILRAHRSAPIGSEQYSSAWSTLAATHSRVHPVRPPAHSQIKHSASAGASSKPRTNVQAAHNVQRRVVRSRANLRPRNRREIALGALYQERNGNDAEPEPVDNLRADHARVRMEEVEAHLDDTYFAWIGETKDDAVTERPALIGISI